MANTITANNTGEWDFSLSGSGLEVGTKYYFRLYPADADTEITYNIYPAITFAEPDTNQQMRGGTWFNDGIEQSKSF